MNYVLLNKNQLDAKNIKINKNKHANSLLFQQIKK